VRVNKRDLRDQQAAGEEGQETHVSFQGLVGKAVDDSDHSDEHAAQGGHREARANWQLCV